MRSNIVMLFSLLVLSCGGTTPASTSPTSGSAAAATTGATATIAGSVSGSAFNAASSAIWIGVPDEASTMAVYLSDKPLSCDDMAKKGWIHTIAPGVQVLEMIMTGSTAQTYGASTESSVPPGSVEIEYIVAGPKKNETRGSSGSVTVTAVKPQSTISGTFTSTFAGNAGKLEGSFTATYCPNAHEP